MQKNAYFNCIKFGIFLFNLMIINVSSAQPALEIKVKLEKYGYDSLWFGQSFGKRAVPEFGVPKQADGSFVLSKDILPADGFYAIIYKRAPKAKYQFFPIVITQNNARFQLTTDINSPYSNAQIINNQENIILFEYLQSIEPLQKSRDSSAFVWRDSKSDVALKNWMAAEQEVRAAQLQTLQKHPNTWASKLAAMTLLPEPPVTNSGEDFAKNRWAWFQKNYFDGKDFAEANAFRSPLSIEFLDYFVFKLPYPEPVEITKACELVFQHLEKNHEHYKYYFNYVVNSFGSISKYRGDEVFHFLVKNYVERGKAPWTSEAEMSKLSDNATRMERVFVGKKAAPVTLYHRDQTPIELQNIVAPYTLLIFWNPDCSHCKKELPVLKKVLPTFIQKGLKVVAICGKSREENKQCWQYADENPFPNDWSVLHDPEGKSRMGALYNLRTFPRMFLLDAEKNIVWKRAGEVPEKEIEQVFSDFLLR